MFRSTRSFEPRSARAVLALHVRRAKQQTEKRRLVDGGYLGDRPVVATGGVSHRPQTNTKVIPNALTFTMEIHGGAMEDVRF